MSITVPTYIDLFGSEAQALQYYKSLFPLDVTIDQNLLALINLSYMKIDPIFGEFRNYTVGEDTVRNEHMKRAVCFEANSIILINAGTQAISAGALNTPGVDTRVISTDKIEDVSTTYDTTKKSAHNTFVLEITDSLGLLSLAAASFIVRYIRKTYNMGTLV